MRILGKKRCIPVIALLFVMIMLAVVPVYAKGGPRMSLRKYNIVCGHALKIKIRDKGKGKVIWSTSNKRVATVTKWGYVKTKKTGKVVIRAKLNGKTLECNLTVKPKTYSGYTWNGERIEDIPCDALPPNPKIWKEPLSPASFAGEPLFTTGGFWQCPIT